MSSALLTPSRNKRLPPEVSGGLPLLGHTFDFQRNPVRFLSRAYRDHGEIFSFVLAGTRTAVFVGPRANEAFFRASDDTLSAKEAYKFTIPIFGPGIAYDTTQDRMDEQLGFVMPALTERRFRTYAGYIWAEVENYIDRLGDSGEIDLLQLCNEMTVFIASRCLIGREFRENLSTEFAHLYHDLEGGLNIIGLFWPNLPLPAFKRRDRARKRMVELISRVIAERKSSGSVEEDFLQTLMTAHYRDNSTLSDENITGLLLTLIFAGQHTSAVLAAWSGIELLRHPRTLAQVLQEQDRLLPADRELRFEDLREMTELERAIKETERLHPPLVVLMRKVIGDFTYRDCRIPPGWMAMVSPGASHRIPEIFAEPDQFDPDRFAPPREEDRKAKHSMITFGGGKHGCIGMTFAYLQVKAIWSILLRRFDLELLHRQPEPNFATFVVGPKPPCVIRYRRRKASTRVAPNTASASNNGR